MTTARFEVRFRRSSINGRRFALLRGVGEVAWIQVKVAKAEQMLRSGDAVEVK